MEIRLKFHRLLSMLFICLSTTVFSQDENKNSVGDVIYEEYRNGDIDKALEKYRNLKTQQSADYNFTEWELNRIGYQIMHNDGDLEAAEKVFKLNIEEYPQAANPHDSYGDYLLEKGDKQEARKHYEKAIAMAEKSTREDEKELLKMSKAKLAKLENKHKQLDFLAGTWGVTGTEFNNDMPSGLNKGSDECIYDDDLNMYTITHKDQAGKVMAKRIIVYNATSGSYDMAVINADAPMGIEKARLSIKETGDNTYELIEEYEEDGKNKRLRHELKRNGEGKMDWVIFEEGKSATDWKKVYAMDMTQNN